jgi:hypothetical protein
MRLLVRAQPERQAPRDAADTSGVKALILIAVTVALAACSSENDGSSSPGGSGPCNAAFEDAAAVDDMSDTVDDLYTAALACSGLADWIAAAQANPGAIDADPASFAINMCTYGPADVAASTVCVEALATRG